MIEDYYVHLDNLEYHPATTYVIHNGGCGIGRPDDVTSRMEQYCIENKPVWMGRKVKLVTVDPP